MEVRQRIESYMLDLNLYYEEVDQDMWMIEDELTHIDNIVVKHLDPIILFRVKVMELPEANREELYKKLLELNASGLVHGAYAIEENSIVLLDTLEAQNMDMNEFQATIESIIMALTEHYVELKSFHD